MHDGIRMLLVLAFAAWGSQASAQTWRYYPPLHLFGVNSIAVGDLDGDGIDEAMFVGSASADHVGEYVLAVVGGEPGVPDRLRAATLPGSGFVRSGDRHRHLVRGSTSDGRDFVATLMYEEGRNKVAIFSGVPLRRERTVTPDARVRELSAFIELNGAPKLVALVAGVASGDSYPAIIDLTSGATDWIGSEQAHAVAVAPLGSDGALKLVVGGTPGRILDAATRTLEWSWAPGFGRHIEVGNFGPQGQPGFAIRMYTGDGDPESRVDVFGTQPYARTRSFPNTHDVVRIIAVPEESGAGDLLALGRHPLGGVQGDELALYRPSSGELVRSLPLACGAIGDMAAGRIDGSGKYRLISSTSENTSITRLCVVDLANGATLYEALNEQGPYSAIARADFGGNGSDEVVVLSASRGGGGSAIRVFDALSGDLLRTTWTEQQFSGTPFVATAQLDADPQFEVIIPWGGSQQWVEVKDGLTFERQWLASPSEFHGTIGLAVADTNGDGTADVLLLTPQSRLIVLDGRTGTELWHSLKLPGYHFGNLAAFSLGGVPHAAIGVARGVYLVNLAERRFVANYSAPDPVVAVRQWQDGGSCRIGFTTSELLQSSVLSVHECATLASVTEWALPFSPRAFWWLGDADKRFLLAANRHLHELRPDGALATLPEDVGIGLALGNQGEVQVSADGTMVDAILGSHYQIARLQARLDEIFADGFEVRP